ncbi:NADP-specific glutamate dehydrogenase [Arenicella xantha]|uniref:Glutamate dehydrogenase n=1 Tax=Arenicella xantha TaxID=644221 RepID=A0A395JIZ8_9GAMM|nr:NADP-specific glutamate dehydrogenase [Arenicella xantha]RBP50692.1 glutamate dehydrogenase (NADP) [Arenicella xantha]
MSNTYETDEVDAFMAGLERRNSGETEFLQAVEEVATTILPYIAKNPKYKKARILERMCEPDRMISFRVAWEDDEGNVRVNRGYRVQCNNAIGPYKGGLRFHKSVTPSILKFLAFEQTFKNSLTGLPMGGGKGGADFNPQGKSDREVMHFCQAFMTELFRHIGPNTDVPAGDIGVGAREVSYMFGQYKRLKNEFVGVLTGKGLQFGGSEIRTEATGYGCVYMMQDMLNHHDMTLKDQIAIVSGSGNVAQYTCEKATQLGAKVVTMSDSSGYIYDKDGIDAEKLAFIMELKGVRRGRISEYADKYGVEFHAGKAPWSVKGDLAFPCATQNEITVEDAKTLIGNGIKAVCEGANMPTYKDGIDAFQHAGVLFAPSKAANAGGVAVSGLEMTQNSMRLSWDREELDARLRKIMTGIHDSCVKHGDGHPTTDQVDYVKGANIAGFIKVADAMLAYGVM